MTRRKIDWLRVEQEIRDCLSAYMRGDILGIHACRAIDEIVAYHTCRGNELPAESLPWESEGDLMDVDAFLGYSRASMKN